MVVHSGNPLWDYPVMEVCFTWTPVVLAHDHTHHECWSTPKHSTLSLVSLGFLCKGTKIHGGRNMAPLCPSMGLGEVYAAVRLAGSPGRAFAPQRRLHMYVTWLFSTVYGSKIKIHIHPAHIEHEQKVMICTSVKWWRSTDSEACSVQISFHLTLHWGGELSLYNTAEHEL